MHERSREQHDDRLINDQFNFLKQLHPGEARNTLCFQNNIALEGSATQIDTFNYNGNILDASKAINGDILDISHTNTMGESAWWLLTLNRLYLICEIRVSRNAFKCKTSKTFKRTGKEIGLNLVICIFCLLSAT